MNITLQELADAARVYLDDDHKDTEGWLSPAAWIRLANTEYTQQYRRWVRLGLIAPTAIDVSFTTSTQSLTGVLEIVGVVEDMGGGRYREIEPAQSRLGRAPFLNTYTQGKATTWQASGTGDALTVSLNPQGSGNYIVRYLAQPTRATALTSTLIVPDGAEERLILGMTRRAHLKDNGASALLEKLITEADSELAFMAFGRAGMDSPRVRVLKKRKWYEGLSFFMGGTASTTPPPPSTPVSYPTAGFTSSVSLMTATFADTSTAVAPATVASRLWDFGDSTTSALASPSHTYSTGGTFTVTLTVTDSLGYSNSTSHQVVIVADNGELSVAILGQSNAAGKGDPDTADPDYTVTTGFAGAYIDTSNHQSDPDIPTIVAARPLQAFGAGGGVGMGCEIGLGRYLYQHTGKPIRLDKFAWDGTGVSVWLNSSTYPTQGTGGNLQARLFTYLDARVAANGRPIDAVVWIQGEADAVVAGDSTAYAARLTTLMTQLRARYGNFWLVLVKLNAAASGAGSYVSNVRSQQVTYAASDARCTLVDVDDVPLSNDNLHYGSNALITIGHRCAEAVAAAVVAGYTGNRGAGPAPYLQGAEPAVVIGSAGAVAPRVYPHKAGDVLYFHLHGSYNNLAAPSAPAGWTLVASAGPTNLAGNYVTGAVYQKIATGPNTPAPSVVGGNIDNMGRVYVVRGGNATTPTSVSATATGSASTITAPAVTTTSANNLVLSFIGGFTGGTVTLGAPTNASLASFSRRYGETLANPSTDKTWITLDAGTLAAAGSSGSETYAITASYQGWDAITLAVKP